MGDITPFYVVTLILKWRVEIESGAKEDDTRVIIVILIKVVVKETTTIGVAIKRVV